MKRKTKLLGFLFVIILAACSSSKSYCPEQETIYAHNKLGEIYQLYADYLNLYKKYTSVGGTIRYEDIQRINDVKQIAINLKTPECLDKAKYYMIDSMTATVGAFELALTGDTSGTTEQLIEGSRLISLADQELLKLRRCFPNCTKEDME